MSLWNLVYLTYTINHTTFQIRREHDNTPSLSVIITVAPRAGLTHLALTALKPTMKEERKNPQVLKLDVLIHLYIYITELLSWKLCNQQSYTLALEAFKISSWSSFLPTLTRKHLPKHIWETYKANHKATLKLSCSYT